MFDRHKALNYPQNTRQSLWRYIPYERLLDLLKSKELFFTHVPKFSDALEGSLTGRSRDHLTSWFQRMNGSSNSTAIEEVKKYEEAQDEFYASCWHMNNIESYLMWKAYAERGYAIRTTFERLQASFDSFAGTVTGGTIDYIDFTRDTGPVGNVFHLVMTKDLPYSDEREFRLLFWKIDPINANLQTTPIGIGIPVDISMLIDTVFVNPINPSVPGELLDLLEQYKIPMDGSSLKYRNTS